jgi:pimeloyl-ACP methyl ester carboxylesterase
MATLAVYVHGLWMTGLEGALLRRRLKRRFEGDTIAFRYHSVSQGLAANAEALAQQLRAHSADRIHLVAHSLGGLVVLKLFEQGAVSWLPPGRVVLLGSPVQGSRAAATFARLPLGLRAMGRCVREELLEPRIRRWVGGRELGVIAGSRALGLGRLMGVGGEPNDGTIYVSETRIPGMAEHLVMPVSHSRLPFSAAVALHTVNFLASGRFAG